MNPRPRSRRPTSAPTPTSFFPRFRLVPEETGAHVVLLRGPKVLMAADWPRSAEVDARLLLVRPIEPGDAAALVRFHEGLDEHSQYLRFFTAHPHLSACEVERFTHVDHAEREALVVTHAGRIVGVGRYDRIDGGTTAEVAFIVSQHWRGLGVATTLLHALASPARAHGITTFVAETLGCNETMRDVFAHAGFPATSRFAGGVVETTIDLERGGDRADA